MSTLRRAVIDAPGREPGVDLARGLAVFGMFAAHLLDTGDGFVWGDPSTWVAAVDGNSSILFATLAGLSLALVSGGAEPHRGARLGLTCREILVRAACIWAIGVVLALTPAPVYVILPAYGILFVASLAVIRLRALPLVGVAVASAVVGPFVVAAIGSGSAPNPEGATISMLTGWHYPFVLWIAFLAAGMAIGRAGLGVRMALVALLVGAGVSILGFALGDPESEILSTLPHSSGMGEAFGSGGLAIAIIGACVLLCRTPATWLVWPIRAVGSMPLTAYVAQLVAWDVWFAVASARDASVTPLAGFRELEPFWPMSIAVLVGCTAWTLLLGRGPLERMVGAIARTLSAPAVAPRPRQ
ncbi:heparan-alpha-glucosaminide N-acetyltransferase domain-containing protein [Microbacterium indicum]|uniref:heparan-alpha-glucosaminide N-acetyltransferase domain-containing protein n=1 Tax=Microbacterium indicum TaxID=358100 RepID=UPI00040C1AB3|nr:heparan-alpha-glucosaminide N-acetyltransferase domain-containing protein [Microbacterium indicum]